MNININNNNNTNNSNNSNSFYGYVSQSSAPRKYFSKPKTKRNVNNSTTDVYLS